MSLADDLVLKLTAPIHTMPLSIANNIEKKMPDEWRNLSGKYVDEDGKITSCLELANKYGTYQEKVRRLFKNNPASEAHRLLKTDLRATNGQRGIYLLPDGTDTTSQKVADYYGVSLSTVQKAWTKFKKDPVKANEHLMAKFKPV